VAEIPGYLEGINPLSIEAISKRLARMLNLSIDLSDLREAGFEWESRVSKAVEKDQELAETIKKLEEAYDNQLIGESE
jgi:proteasome assembly chaperone (PAC2) family protein